MPACDVCKARKASKDLAPRLAIPEYRVLIGYWPWVQVEVCAVRLEAHDRDFLERLRLLARRAGEQRADRRPGLPGMRHAGGRRMGRWIEMARRLRPADSPRDLPPVRHAPRPGVHRRHRRGEQSADGRGARSGPRRTAGRRCGPPRARRRMDG